MKKSGIFLVIIIASPILVVLFLQLFGENRFEVPVYHQEFPPDYCGCENIEIPYSLPTAYRLQDSLQVVMFHEGIIKEALSLQCTRISDKIDGKNVAFKRFGRNSRPHPGIQSTTVSGEDYSLTRMCVYHLDEGMNTVLVDGSGKIRGYYDINEREEVDRLSVEIDILLENGENKSE